MNADAPRPEMVTKILSLLIPWFLAVAPCAIAGAVYQWTDADGAVHFTDDPGKIPKKFHDSVEQLRPPDQPKEPKAAPSEESESAVESKPEAPPKPASEPERVQPTTAPSEPVDAHGHNEEWWRKRVQEWQEKEADAQAKLADAQERLGQERFLNATTGNMKRIQDISAEVEMYEKQIREAENMLTDGLPDEARKAQAPPGWARE